MILGFSGSRAGMTPGQSDAIGLILLKLLPVEMHHGGAIGADEQFHELVELLGWPNGKGPLDARIFCHQGDIPSQRASIAECRCDRVAAVKPCLERNRNIVNASDVMLFTPQGFEEELRSGTWATVRYCRKVTKPHAIVYPDGRVERFGGFPEC